MPALLEKGPTLVRLCLDGCGLTPASKPSLLALLQASNVRKNEGHHKRDLNTWAGGLREHNPPKRGASRAAEAPSAGTVECEVEGLEALQLAGNMLGEEGGLALARPQS